MAIGRGLVDGQVVCKGCCWVHAICLLRPEDVLTVRGGLGLGDVENSGAKAISIKFNLNIGGLDVHVRVEGSEGLVGAHWSSGIPFWLQYPWKFSRPEP